VNRRRFEVRMSTKEERRSGRDSETKTKTHKIKKEEETDYQMRTEPR
jgi:hypothetical protein